MRHLIKTTAFAAGILAAGAAYADTGFVDGSWVGFIDGSWVGFIDGSWVGNRCAKVSMQNKVFAVDFSEVSGPYKWGKLLQQQSDGKQIKLVLKGTVMCHKAGSTDLVEFPRIDVILDPNHSDE